MRKNVFVFGTIAGLISIAWLTYLPFVESHETFEHGELIGYTTMLVAFSMIVVAVKNYRDKQNGGFITFGKAFRMGLGISLVASTIYVVAWLIFYFSSGTNLVEDYTATYLKELKTSGVSEKILLEETRSMAEFGEMYKNPFFNALMTYMEILPLGIVVSLLAALIMKRKPKQTITQ